MEIFQHDLNGSCWQGEGAGQLDKRHGLWLAGMILVFLWLFQNWKLGKQVELVVVTKSWPFQLGNYRGFVWPPELAGAECGSQFLLCKVWPFSFVISFSMSHENKFQSSQHDVNKSFHCSHPLLSFKYPPSFVSRAWI